MKAWGSVLLVAVAAFSSGKPVPFPRVFAPQEGRVTPVERPCRDEWCLNGSWQFQPVADSLPPPQASAWERTPIRIPSPWNVNAFPVESREGGDFRAFPSYPQAWERARAGWLRRNFEVPASWTGKRIVLRFDAIAGDAQVFVNGKPVARHFDLFLPFEVDVTDVVRIGGPNELLIGVRKASLTDVPGPYGRRTYQGGSMWGQAIAGIWQDVFLEAVPAVRVAETFVKPDLATDTLAAEVTLRNDTDAPRTVRLTGDVYPWLNRARKGTLVAPEPQWALGRKTLELDASSSSPRPEKVVLPAHGTATVTLSAKVGGRLKVWEPGRPNLYTLVCRIDGDAQATRFGWRQLTFSGTAVLLNGKPLVMRGDSWHFMGIPQMTRRYAWAWFKTLQDAGLNAVRLHAEPYPSFYLDMADEMGILVLDETAVWASDGGPKLDSDAFWSDTQRHLRDLIHRDRNHPSVFGWSVSNEVMAVVRNVFHAPKSVEDKASAMNGVWAAICRIEDPTRLWISADGEEDGQGQLPVSVIHYGDQGTMERAIARGKPWGVGEAGPAYYGTPKQIAQMAKDPRAYLSFADRMEGVAKVSYASLKDQNDLSGAYRSVFNLVWYGLKPLALGMKDTTRPPTLDDGITFPPFVEGQPGVQPERLGPYCSTLNPGYDPSLPRYRAWPLFDAIRAAAHGEPFVDRSKPLDVGKVRTEASIAAVRLLSDVPTGVVNLLEDLGVKVDDAGGLLFVDANCPPGPEAKATIDAALAGGETVVVWGGRKDALHRLNALLPRPFEFTERLASSLVATPDPLTGGLEPSALYFSETSPPQALTLGLGGPLMVGAKALLSACDTDWRRWNGQAETVKTAMVLRSEREAKPSGIALAEVAVGKGRLLVCTLPLDPERPEIVFLDRTIFANLGVALRPATEPRNLLEPSGKLSAGLYSDPYFAGSVEAALAATPLKPGPTEFTGLNHLWARRGGFGGALRTNSLAAYGYASLWLYSPKDLSDLLLDPHLPTVGLTFEGINAAQTWIDGQAVPVEVQGGRTVVSRLALHRGWNFLVVKLVRRPGAPDGEVTLRLNANQPDFLGQMRAAFEKPPEGEQR